MTKNKVLRARVTDAHLEKLGRIGEAMGLSASHIVRLLIDSAEVQTKPSVLLGQMKNSDSASDLRNRSAITVSA